MRKILSLEGIHVLASAIQGVDIAMDSAGEFVSLALISGEWLELPEPIIRQWLELQKDAEAATTWVMLNYGEVLVGMMDWNQRGAAGFDFRCWRPDEGVFRDMWLGAPNVSFIKIEACDVKKAIMELWRGEGNEGMPQWPPGVENVAKIHVDLT